MLLARPRAALVAVLLSGVTVAATAQPPADPPPKEKEVAAWGRRFGGLQAGLVVRGGAKKVYRLGDTVTLGVRVRNVGKEAVTFAYVPQFLDESSPAVTDPDGNTLTQHNLEMLGVAHPAKKVTLDPGQEVELESRSFGAAGRRYELTPVGGARATKERQLFVTTGVVSVRQERVFGDSSIGKAEVDPTHLRLGTGAVEFEVEAAARR